MSEEYIYIFIRQDLSLAQQIVQSNHASLYLATFITDRKQLSSNLVFIGVPNKYGLYDAMEILSTNNINYIRWRESSPAIGLTAFATFPISGDKRECLGHYEIWKPENQCIGDLPPKLRSL